MSDFYTGLDNSYVSARQRAQKHRDQYGAWSIAQAQMADRAGLYNPAMGSNESRVRSNNLASDAQQIGSPWDAWFQTAEEGGWQAPTSNVRERGRGRARIADDPESSFNKNPHMRPSIKALTRSR